MAKATSIKPLSDFVRNTKSQIEMLKSSSEPEVNGEATIVVQDARLQAAMEYFREGGKGMKAEDVFASLEKKYL